MTDDTTYEIYYDKEADFLEIFIGEQTKSLAEEIELGVFIRKDIKTNEVKSIGILGFKKKETILKRYLQRNKINLPLDIYIAH